MNFLCRDCWLVHGTATDCVLETLRMRQTPEGKAELERRKGEAYRRAGGQRDAQTQAEGFHWAQKHGIPYAALRALREGPQETPALKAARDFIGDGEALFLLLLGPTGVGKTLAASLVVVDFCLRWPWNQQATGAHSPLIYEDAATLIRLSAFDLEDQRRVQALKDCRLLVLEDVGDEATKLGLDQFVEVVMHREKTRRRTVLTTNLTGQAFKLRYGEAVADRIKAHGYVPNLAHEKSRRMRGVA